MGERASFSTSNIHAKPVLQTENRLLSGTQGSRMKNVVMHGVFKINKYRLGREKR
jgi:hypothetical protein